MPNYKLNLAMATHRGIRRDHNEDAVAYYYPSDFEVLSERGVLFVLADGVGSLPDGEKASQYSVQRLIELYYDAPLAMSSRDALQTSIEQVNVEVFRNFEAHLATTLVAVVVRQAQVITAYVGDSRLYWFDGRKVRQYTEDHTMAVLNEKKQYKMKLTRAIGHISSVEVDIHTDRISTGQGLLLVSDGATAYLNEDDLLTLMKENPREIVGDIIQYSIQGGGHDNISAIMVSVGDLLSDAESLKCHLQTLTSQGVSVYVADKVRQTREIEQLNRLRWRFFLVIIILLVTVILSLIVFMTDANQQEFASITQIPAAATLNTIQVDATSALPPNVILVGQSLIFDEAIESYTETNSTTMSFMIVPNAAYQVISTFIDDNDLVWYQVYESETDRSAWIVETDLPTYTASN